MRELPFTVPETQPPSHAIDGAYATMASSPIRALSYAVIAGSPNPLTVADIHEEITHLWGSDDPPHTDPKAIASHCRTLAAANLLASKQAAYRLPARRDRLVSGLGAAAQVGDWHTQYPGYGSICFGGDPAWARQQMLCYSRLLDSSDGTVAAEAIGKRMGLEWEATVTFLSAVTRLGILRATTGEGGVQVMTRFGLCPDYAPALTDIHERRLAVRDPSLLRQNAQRVLDILDPYSVAALLDNKQYPARPNARPGAPKQTTARPPAAKPLKIPRGSRPRGVPIQEPWFPEYRHATSTPPPPRQAALRPYVPYRPLAETLSEDEQLVRGQHVVASRGDPSSGRARAPLGPKVLAMTPDGYPWDWPRSGHCYGLADPDQMFPLPGSKQQIDTAKAICDGCPPEEACLKDALDTGDPHGVRAGLTADERRAHITELRKKAAQVRIQARPRPLPDY